MWQRVRERMFHVSAHVNHALAPRVVDVFPWYFVSEFPKSGGTWLARMLADVLVVPRPERSIFPIGTKAVVQNHWKCDDRRSHRTIYLFRDGRDVMVSAYFHMLRASQSETLSPAARRRAADSLAAGQRAGFDASDVRAGLPVFMDRVLGGKRSGPYGLSWPMHVRNWRTPEAKRKVTYVSYEQLLGDCAAHLKRVAEAVSGSEIADWRVEMAVEKFSMRNLTGRSAGQEDRSSFIRKGVAGDWVNHFSAESARLFDRYAGDTLIDLGYEADASWVDRTEG